MERHMSRRLLLFPRHCISTEPARISSHSAFSCGVRRSGFWRVRPRLLFIYRLSKLNCDWKDGVEALSTVAATKAEPERDFNPRLRVVYNINVHVSREPQNSFPAL